MKGNIVSRIVAYSLRQPNGSNNKYQRKYISKTLIKVVLSIVNFILQGHLFDTCWCNCYYVVLVPFDVQCDLR